MGLIIKSAVKKSAGMRISSDFLEMFDKHVENELKKAVERAKKNNRVTLRSHDF